MFLSKVRICHMDTDRVNNFFKNPFVFQASGQLVIYCTCDFCNRKNMSGSSFPVLHNSWRLCYVVLTFITRLFVVNEVEYLYIIQFWMERESLNCIPLFCDASDGPNNIILDYYCFCQKDKFEICFLPELVNRCIDIEHLRKLICMYHNHHLL